MTGLQLRHAHLADANAIAVLHIASWRTAYSAELPAAYLASLDESARTEQWRSRLLTPGTQVLLAERDGVLCGFCAYGPVHRRGPDVEGFWEIYSLHVLPERRGSGIGSMLFGEALSTARRAGAPVLTLWVVETNAPARRFYEAKGMQPDGAEKQRELAPGIALHEVRYRSEVARP